jgi:HSF-type DNA-binding
LIQAATSQLEHLAQGDPSDWSAHSPSHGDDYASSSDGGDFKSSTPIRTPTMIAEDFRSFPEVLMAALIDPANIDIITFLPDGKFFAVRVKEFSDDLLRRLFALSSFDEFVDLLVAWGFNSISGNEDAEKDGNRGETGKYTEANMYGGIQVFRHPQFRKGGNHDLRQVHFFPTFNPIGSGSGGDLPPMPKLPEQPTLERRMSDASVHSCKRRLSPSHPSGDRDLEAIKQRTIEKEWVSVGPSFAAHYRPARRRSSIDIRSKALAVTAAQLSLDDGQPSAPGTTKSIRRASLSLVDGGVDTATHNIVTDAIETLLFDEYHTRETYLKHEKELSQSSLPGVIPISKQLFSPTVVDGLQSGVMRSLSRLEQIAAAAKALYPDGERSSLSVDVSGRNLLTVSPSQLEAAAALVKQAGLKEEGWSGEPLKRRCITAAESSAANVVSKEEDLPE